MLVFQDSLLACYCEPFQALGLEMFCDTAAVFLSHYLVLGRVFAWCIGASELPLKVRFVLPLRVHSFLVHLVPLLLALLLLCRQTQS